MADRPRDRTTEADVESELVRRVEALGGDCPKVTVLGRRGFYDRLIVLPGGRIIFCELKRPKGGRVSRQQRDWHALYRRLGCRVVVVRTLADIEKLLGSVD